MYPILATVTYTQTAIKMQLLMTDLTLGNELSDSSLWIEKMFWWQVNENTNTGASLGHKISPEFTLRDPLDLWTTI